MSRFFISALFVVLLFSVSCSNDSDTISPERQEELAIEASLKSAGASATDILANDNFTDLLIEIAYVEGFRPTDEALEGLVNFLQERTFKENIELKFTELESPEEEDLSLTEIAELESENRTVYNDGATLGIYIYFADAPAEDDDDEADLVTLGAVYRNTSMIIHEATVRKLAGQSFFISEADVENSTLNHEFGHLFGLVNLGTPAINDHEGIITDDEGDPVLDSDGNATGNNHCDVDGCLMLAELQFGGPSQTSKGIAEEGAITAACRLSGTEVLKMLESKTSKDGLPEPPSLDSECLLDLSSVGGR